MKNLKNFAVSRTGIISIVSIAIILFAISSIDERKKTEAFEISESKIIISGTNNSFKWKMEANSITCSGDFESKGNELLTIRDLGFTLPISMLKSDNYQLDSNIYELFKNSNWNQLAFKQQHYMILPIMKKIHMIGELNILNGKYSLPMQVSYELSNDQTLRIRGKQVINLSQCGIKIPSHLIGTINDEVELEIDFLLVNKTI